MNDHVDFERFVAGHIADEGATPPSDAFYDELFTRAGGSGQRPEWLALIKESPMRTSSRTTVGSPTVRVVAVLIATILLAVSLAAAGAGVQRLFAAGGPIIVAQDGSGDHTTIQAAVDAAIDGGEILVRPGRYVENVAIVGKDLTIAGEGKREDIVLELDTDAGPADVDWTALLEEGDEPYPTAILVAESRVTLSGIAILADQEEEAILVLGPAATADIAEVSVRSLGEIPGGINAVFWERGAGGSLRDSHIEGWVGLNEGANVIVEGNEMPATCLGVWEDDADVVIRRNVIHGCEYEKGLEITGDSTALIEGNDIWVEEVEPGPPNDDWGGRVAITVNSSLPVTIRDNDVHDSRTGILLLGGGLAALEQNRVSANEVGVDADHFGSIEMTGNVIEDNGVGLVLNGLADSSLQDNRICDNGINVQLTNRASAPDPATNEVCEDTTTE